MRTLLAAIFLAAASCSPSTTPAPAAAAAAPAVPVYSYQVVNTYPHDKTAFTEGLQFIDGAMYESTGMEGSSWLRRYDLATGAVQAEHVIDKQYFGEGSVVLSDKIISLTWKAEKGFIYDLASFTPKGEFPYPGEGWGLTTDGKRIIMSDGSADLRFWDPETLKETGRITVTEDGRPVRDLNELEWVKGEICRQRLADRPHRPHRSQHRKSGRLHRLPRPVDRLRPQRPHGRSQRHRLRRQGRPPLRHRQTLAQAIRNQTGRAVAVQAQLN